METAEKAAEIVQKGSEEGEQVVSVEAVETGAKTEAKAETETEVRAAEREAKREKKKHEHPMRRVELDKVVINIGVGKAVRS